MVTSGDGWLGPSLWHWSILSAETYAYNDHICLQWSSFIYVHALFVQLHTCSSAVLDSRVVAAGINWSHDVSIDGYQLECKMTTAKCFKSICIFNSLYSCKVFFLSHKNEICYSAHWEICRDISISVLTITVCTTILLMEYKIIHT